MEQRLNRDYSLPMIDWSRQLTYLWVGELAEHKRKDVLFQPSSSDFHNISEFLDSFYCHFNLHSWFAAFFALILGPNSAAVYFVVSISRHLTLNQIFISFISKFSEVIVASFLSFSISHSLWFQVHVASRHISYVCLRFRTHFQWSVFWSICISDTYVIFHAQSFQAIACILWSIDQFSSVTF